MPECPCGSDSSYEECCGRYIEKGINPPTAEALMRSRYCAYVKGVPEYIAETALEPPPIGEIVKTIEETEFLSLQVVETKRGGALDRKGVVEFKARYITGRTEGVLHERSSFVKKKGVWLYDEKGSLFMS